jgi:hypothetical protein
MNDYSKVNHVLSVQCAYIKKHEWIFATWIKLTVHRFAVFSCGSHIMVPNLGENDYAISFERNVWRRSDDSLCLSYTLHDMVVGFECATTVVIMGVESQLA